MARFRGSPPGSGPAPGDGVVGRVSWGERKELTLHLDLVHMIAATEWHAGHADIVRELIDGAVGLRNGSDNVPPGDSAWWETCASGWSV